MINGRRKGGGAEMEMTSEFYSSTSSDDQSSINSVIHVETALDTADSSDSSAPPTPKRQKQSQTPQHPRSQAQHPHLPHHQQLVKHAVYQNGGDIAHASLAAALQDDDTSTDSDDREEEALLRLEEEGGDSDSSTSSEETQIWVQQSSASKPRPAPRPQVPPKPSYRHSSGDLSRPSTNSNMPAARQSVVSQNSVTGRVETALVNEENTNNGDSGISNNESPGTQSSGENILNAPPPMPRLSSFPALRPSPHSPPAHTSTPLQQYLARTAQQRDSTHSHSSHSSQHRVSSSSQPQSQSQAQAPFSPSHSHIITLHPIPSPAPSPLPASISPRAGECKEEEDQLAMEAHCKESLFNILSGLYAIFLVVLGISLPIAEAFAPTLNKGVFEGFYIYLFVVSILFLLYVYTFLLRTRTSSRLRHRSKLPAGEDALLRKSPSKCKVSMASEEHTGSFYLRLGAMGFGICAMIYEGLMFGALFELGVGSLCVHIAQVIRPIVQLTFTFVQLYFIFLNSKMCIHRYRVFARFGLTHMIATNLCVWLRTITTEILRELLKVEFQPLYEQGMDHKHGPNDSDAASDSEEYTWANFKTGCRPAEILGGVVMQASPYLYPCTVQYSLVAAGILYIMWRHIGESTPSHSTDASTQERSKKSRSGVDCSSANRGLFFGIFTLVAIIITRIVFFVLVGRPSFGRSATMLVYISEIVLYFLTTLAVLIAMARIRDMKFHRDRDHALDGILLITSLTGVFIFSVFSMIAAQFSADSTVCLLIVATGVLILFQSTLQTVFILNGLKRSSRTAYHESQKPGREYITFLLVCNIGMWGINAFEVLRYDANPLALQFYGSLPWNIVTHISMPLIIFYRFHSMVSLATVWRSAYKQIKVV